MRKSSPAKETTLDPEHPLSDPRSAPAMGRFLAIYSIGRSLLEQRSPAEVIATIQRGIVEQLQPDHACFLSVAPDGSYRPVLAHRLDLGQPLDSWALSKTVLRRACHDGVAVLSQQSQSDPRLSAAESVQRLNIHSVMCVPIGKPVRGLLYVDNRRHKPFVKDDLEFLNAVALYASRVLEHVELEGRTRNALELSEERLALLQGELLRHRIVGRSPKLLAAYDALKRLAAAGARVVLRGETGVGKELFARAYAANSPRLGKAYVPVPIPALAASLIESELFGHVKGAFTEAGRDKKGRLELADGGVLFLDEIGDIEPGPQAKLLRFLDAGEIHRVGDTEERRVDVLVVSATNRALEKDVEAGRFRADLLARLGNPIQIPALRERADDIPLLLDHQLALHARASRVRRFSADAVDVLRGHAWPFNVRELQQVVERVACLVDREVIEPEDLPEYIRERASSRQRRANDGLLAPLRDIVEDAERAHILKALELTKGNKRRAIELLQVSSETFYRRLEDFGLKQKD